MVAKLGLASTGLHQGYLLAKIHMVAKLRTRSYSAPTCYLLAKIHMVAKPYQSCFDFL